MSVEAIREVTVKVNVRTGQIEKLNLPYAADMHNIANSIASDFDRIRERVAETNKGQKAFIETTHELRKEVLASERDIKNAFANPMGPSITRRPLAESDDDRQKIRERKEAANENRKSLNDEMRLREALAERARAIEDEQTRHKTEGLDAIAARYRKLASEEEKAVGRMPQVWRQTQQNLSQAVGSLGVFIAHLGSLKNVAGDSVEDLAKQFVKVHASIGLITSSSNMFTNVGQTLSGLRRAGELTEDIVKSQRAHGLAVTFSQAATMRLATAAGVAQAALGPIGLIMTGAMTAIVAAETAMNLFGEDADEIAKQQERHLEKYNDQLQDIIRGDERHADLLKSKTTILEGHWDLMRKLKGDEGLNNSELLRERKQLTDDNTFNLRNTISAGLDKAGEGISDGDKSEFDRLKSRKAELENKLAMLRETVRQDPGSAFIFNEQINAHVKVLAQIDQKEAALRDKSGLSTLEGLKSTAVADGRIVDFDAFKRELDKLPEYMRDEQGELLKDIADKVRDQLKVEGNMFDQSRRAISDAESAKAEADREIADRKKNIATQEDMAARFGRGENQMYRDEVAFSLDEFDRTPDPDQRAMIAKEIESILRERELLSTETGGMFKGSQTDTKAVRRQLENESVFTAEERAREEQELARATTAAIESRSRRETTARLNQEAERNNRAVDAELEAIRRAIMNR